MTRPHIPLDGERRSQPLPDAGIYKKRVHIFERRDLEAINAALAAERPLLLRGEPGTGKTQLAEGAAAALGWPIARRTLDARTEARDLLYEVDHVQRLGKAQLLAPRPSGAARTDTPGEDTPHPQNPQDTDDPLALRRFVRPGPLWWGLDWQSASGHPLAEEPARPEPNEGQQPWAAGDGCVVLIDEIDKAQAEVPNGLLEVLGQGHFPAPDGAAISCTGNSPLVLITTNEERVLPDAFLRRCFVHWITLPDDETAFVEHLTERGQAHFGSLGDELIRDVARTFFAARRDAPPTEGKPGLAEYMDVLRVLHVRGRTDTERREVFATVQDFVLGKFAAEPPAKAAMDEDEPLA